MSSRLTACLLRVNRVILTVGWPLPVYLGQRAVVNLSQRFGREVATADEARKIMKIGVSYNSVKETLQNLGLPPNRAGGEQGFMVWETDGKKSVAHAMSDSHPMAYCMVPPQQAAE
jgi:hypothetical protein